jgi:hypothetical protein
LDAKIISLDIIKKSAIKDMMIKEYEMSELDYEKLAFEIMPRFFAAGEAVDKTTQYLIGLGCEPENAKRCAYEALIKWTDLWTNG